MYNTTVPEYCVRFGSPADCLNNGCHWCGKGCTTFKSTCVPSCGNSILDEGEECDDGNDEDGDGCSKECKLESGFVCNTGAIPTSCVEKAKKGGGSDGGMIAGICIGVVALIALIVIGVVLVMLMQRRKKEEYAAQMVSLGENNGLGLGAEEMEADVFDPDDGKEIADAEEFPLMFGDSSWTFGLKDGKRGEIGAVLKQKTTVANCGTKKMTWKIYPKRNEKYRIVVRPQEGVIGKGERVSVEAELVLNCTTSVDEMIPVCVWPGKRRDGQGEMVYMYINARAEGKLSTRLDPDEVKLVQPPIGEGSFGTVFRGFYKGQEVAAKVLKNQSWGEKIQELYKEIKIMDELRSPYIVNVNNSEMNRKHNGCMSTQHYTTQYSINCIWSYSVSLSHSLLMILICCVIG